MRAAGSARQPAATREASGARARSKREDLRERLDHPVRPREPSTRGPVRLCHHSAAGGYRIPEWMERGEASGARARSKREDLRERLDHPVRPREPSTRGPVRLCHHSAAGGYRIPEWMERGEASGARARSKREDLRERLDHPVRPREPSTRAAAPPLMPDICNRGV